MSTVDFEKILESGDCSQLGAVMEHYATHRRWSGVLRRVKDGRSPMQLVTRGVAEAALASLDSRGVITAVQALRAERRVLELNAGLRWFTILEAREQGASWQDIAAAVGTSGDHADVITQTLFAEQVNTADTDLYAEEIARARAVLDDPARADSGEPSSPVAES